jgi:CRISPR-associated endonuclease/helicase Cas3
MATGGAIPARIDLAFPLIGDRVPRDHGYALFGALCRALGNLHGSDWLAVHPLRGRPAPDGTLVLPGRQTGLLLRLLPVEIPRVLPLTGQVLDICGHRLQVGRATVQGLAPASSLTARLVVIKGFLEPAPFLDAVQRQLAGMEVEAEVEIGRRRVLNINGDRVVGFEVTLRGLSMEGSLRVQYAGLGGRQRMGCGVFTPVRPSACIASPNGGLTGSRLRGSLRP